MQKADGQERSANGFWTTYIGLDLRSLALLRILFSAVILGDLANRFLHLSEHYGVGSAYPPEAMQHVAPLQNGWSIFLASAENVFPYFPVLVFAVAFLSALALFVGWQTRMATILTWVSILIIQNMDRLILQGGDTMIRIVLLIGIFLPWDRYFSVDSALRYDEKKPTRAASVWTLALLLQISFIYLFAALEKSLGSSWHDGTAVYRALSSFYASHLGLFFLRFPDLLTFLTYAVRIFQLSVVFFIFSPRATAVTRTIAMTLLIGMHFSFNLFLNIGPFSYISMAIVSVLAPTELWEYLRRKTLRWFGSVTIYYDGDCGFCRKSSYLIRTFLLLPNTDVKTAQDAAEIYAAMRAHDSWVIVDENGRRTFTYQAAITLVEHSPLFFWIAPLMRPRWARAIGERTYRYIANRRSRTCTISRSATSLPPRILRAAKLFSTALGIVYIGTIILLNYSTVRTLQMPDMFWRISNTLGTAQMWSMFAPNPTANRGWYIVDGTLENGVHVNAFDPSQPIYFEPPEYLPPTYGNHRWLKYLEAISQPQNAAFRPYFAAYLCGSWNTTHPLDRLKSVDITFMRARALPDSKTSSSTPVHIASSTCDMK